MIHLVLDSNAIIEKNWRLSGPDFELLLQATRGDHIQLVVPELVVQETVNQYRIKLNDKLSKAESATHDLNKLVFHADPIDNFHVDIDREVEQYEQLLRNRLEELGAECPGYDDVPHAVLVGKALERKRPFKEKDRGYRDGLLWEVVLRKVANNDHQTMFVTDNKNDFYKKENDEEIHTDLRQEIEDAHLEEDRIVLYRHLSPVVDEHVKPFLEDRKAQLDNFLFENWFESELNSIISLLTSKISDASEMNFPPELFSAPYIELLGLVTNETEDIYEVDNGEVYIEVNAVVETSFILNVYHMDFYVYADKWDLRPLYPGSDDKVIETCITLSIPARFTLIIDINTIEVTDYDLELPEFYGWCQHCGVPITWDAAEQCPSCGKDLF